MISAKYLAIMCKNIMEEAIIEVIKETCRKEREENRVRKSATYFITDERAF
jgi:hypothetical protein